METRFDAQRQLNELENMRDAVAVEAWIPETPIWHGPLLGLFTMLFALFVEGPSGWQLPAALLCLPLVTFGMWDTLRRRRARRRTLRKPARLLAVGFVTVAVSWVIIVVSNNLVADASTRWPDQAAQFFLTLFAVCLVATVGFTIGIQITNQMRKRWIQSAR